MTTGSTPQPPYQGIPEGHELVKKKKPWFKRPGCITPLAIVALIIGFVAINSGGDSNDSSGKTQTSATSPATTPSGDTGAAEEAPAAEQKDPEPDADVPSEYKNALKSGERYLKFSSFSKQGLFDQLTSEYGDQFSPEAGQYAVDNIDADWNEQALKSGRRYQDTMSMSPSAVYDQLVSDYGEKFTPEQAQYAVDNL